MEDIFTVHILFRTLFLILPISLIYYYWHKKQEPLRNAVNKLPGPYSWPIVGNAFNLAKTPEGK
jgi:hypothetical protein